MRTNVILKTIIVLVAAAVAVGAAWWLGVEAGQEASDGKRRELRALSRQTESERLANMQAVKRGNQLADFEIDLLDGYHGLLSDLVDDTSWLLFIDAECDACILELAGLMDEVDPAALKSHFVAVAYSDTTHLKRIADSLSLSIPIVYDTERRIGIALSVSSFPFSLLVDSDRRIIDIAFGRLTREEAKQFQ